MSENRKPFGNPLPSLGDQVRLWRQAQKMTQAELERKADLSHNTVSRIECGNVSPRVDTLERIGHALAISVEQLQFQKPAETVSEPHSPYGWDNRMGALITALSQVPEPKRGELLRIFMELIRVTTGENDA